ncbi:hypothetical protein BC939DRAFT_448257 [Gamsiella multidivaricata]|uniref:uncharacterized protein n=1 Tax=Gamsiella multidivaricata TaxID=101098 RepID=UPI002220578D|nr:uncharacterized protein BC939DRAFT_448257 [Gamsiella multidivaricata]KAI7825731.1 hypothetical protein BC939DRAFT_448257 [Gamsiella multidivaricata]
MSTHNNTHIAEENAAVTPSTVPTTYSTVDASGYPAKHDGLATHNAPIVLQDPHEHHKHNQVAENPHAQNQHHGHTHIPPPGEHVPGESMVNKPIVEVAEVMRDPKLHHATFVPNFIK